MTINKETSKQPTEPGKVNPPQEPEDKGTETYPTSKEAISQSSTKAKSLSGSTLRLLPNS